MLYTRISNGLGFCISTLIKDMYTWGRHIAALESLYFLPFLTPSQHAINR